MTTRHDDPTISAFLADGDYADIDAWMRDSDYLYVEDTGDGFPGWVDLDDNPVGAPEGVIEGAIEASGFEVPDCGDPGPDCAEHAGACD